MDIDIDFQTSFDPRKVFGQAVAASMVKNDDLVKHPCGHYFQNIPVDPVTSLAAIPYEEAELLGFFKIDFLHLSLLDAFESKTQIRQLLQKEPNWDLLQDSDCVSRLFQLSKHGELLRSVKPRSVQQVADCIALIRPGKKHLLSSYLEDPEGTRKILYQRETAGYSFKRSHAISYALTVVLQLHLIESGEL